MYKGFSSGPDLCFSGESGDFARPPKTSLILFQWQKSGLHGVQGGVNEPGGGFSPADPAVHSRFLLLSRSGVPGKGYLQSPNPGPYRAPIALFCLSPDQLGAKTGHLCTRVFHPGPIYVFMANRAILRGLLKPL